MAIISILISILLPSVRKERNASIDAVCLSNTRQVGTEITVYTSKDDGKFPPHKGSFGTWIDLVGGEGYKAFSCPRVSSWTYSNGNGLWNMFSNSRCYS
jgi:hypothetical protein